MSGMPSSVRRINSGFTIVELLIVIIIIAILAAVTIVSYNGIQIRANDSAVQSDLHNIANRLMQYDAVHGSFPDVGDDTVLASLGLTLSKGSYDTIAPSWPGSDYTTRNIVICIVMSGPLKGYGISAMSKSGTVYSYSQDKGPAKETYSWRGQQSTACPRTLGQTKYPYATLSADSQYVRQFLFLSDQGGWQI